MFLIKDEQSPRLYHWTLSEMGYYFLFLFLLPHCCEGVPQVIGSSQPIVVNIGDDVILPCRLEPPVDAAAHTAEWTRPDLNPRIIHVWRSGEELLKNQNPSYVGRTSLFISELKNGNVSLKLSRVKLSDRGTYRCFIPTINRDTTVELIVGSVSSPSITVSKSSDGVSLDCRSEGWFPVPELLWLNGEGRVLSAGPTETLRGPDGLYTVSSRLNIEKTTRDRFTCRVHQEKITQTREDQVYVSAEFFKICSSSVVYISIIVVLVLSAVVAAAFIFWKWRKIQTKVKKLQQAEAEWREREQLMMNSSEYLEEKKKILEEEFEKIKTEEEDVGRMVHDLEKQSKDLHEQTDTLQNQRENMEKSFIEAEEKLKSVEQMSVDDQAQGYIGIKSTMLKAKSNLLNGNQVFKSRTVQLRYTVDELLKILKTRQKAAENKRVEISEQLKEIQRKLSEHREKT